MVVVASIRHIGENLYSGIFRSILHPGGMKHTSNQKVVTAAIQKHSSKALFAPYPACTALPDEIPSMPLQSKIGACGVSLFTDFKSGNYRRGLSSNFRVGANQIPPLLIPKEESYIPPENRGYVHSGSNLLPENSGYCRHWWLCSARLHFKSNL